MMDRLTAAVTRFPWRRWHAALVVLVALAADYGSPAEMWTAALPLLFMAVLLSFRERGAALAVLFLSSWIAIPASAGAVRAFDAARGVRRIYVVEGQVPGLEEELWARCQAHDVRTISLDGSSSGFGGELRRQVALSFASMHNQLALQDASFNADCFGEVPSQDPNPRVPAAD
jgi:hypothetical protein